MIPLIVGTLAPLLHTIIDRVIPDTAAAEKAKRDVDVQLIGQQHEINKSLLEIAKEDAKTGKGGYRWGAGWLCVISLAYSWIIYPLALWLLAIAQADIIAPPNMPVEAQFAMLSTMLGLGGIRSYDLTRGNRR